MFKLKVLTEILNNQESNFNEVNHREHKEFFPPLLAGYSPLGGQLTVRLIH